MWDDLKRCWPSVIYEYMTQTRLKRNKVSSGLDIPFSIEKQLNPQGNIFKVPMNKCLLTQSLSKKTNIFNHFYTLVATASSRPQQNKLFPPASSFLSELTRTWYSNFVDLHLNSVVVASSAASQHMLLLDVSSKIMDVLDVVLNRLCVTAGMIFGCFFREIIAWYKKHVCFQWKRKMMCLIFQTGLFDGRSICVCHRCSVGKATSLHGSKKEGPSQSQQPLGASEAASRASYISYEFLKDFTHPKDIKLAGQAIKTIGVANSSTTRQTWRPNHKFKKGMLSLSS